MDLEARVRGFFEAAERRDFATFRACFAEDAAVFQNGEALTVDALCRWSEDQVERVRYSDARRIVADDAVVEQHRAEVTLRGGASVVVPDICVVFRFDSTGRFSRVDEYAPIAPVPR